MNKARRAAIQKVIDALTDLQATVELLRDEEEEARDNLPESLQGSERYEAMDEAYSNLELAISNIEEVAGNLEEAMG